MSTTTRNIRVLAGLQRYFGCAHGNLSHWGQKKACINFFLDCPIFRTLLWPLGCPKNWTLTVYISSPASKKHMLKVIICVSPPLSVPCAHYYSVFDIRCFFCHQLRMLCASYRMTVNCELSSKRVKICWQLQIGKTKCRNLVNYMVMVLSVGRK